MQPTAPFFIGRIEGQDASFDAWPEQTLLQSMETGGLDWPSSCRNGTCRTCIGRLSVGRVRYVVEWPGLTTEEQAEGLVLPCVAHPISDVVLLTSGE